MNTMMFPGEPPIRSGQDGVDGLMSLAMANGDVQASLAMANGDAQASPAGQPRMRKAPSSRKAKQETRQEQQQQQQQKYRTSLFGYDIRLVHALIKTIRDHVLSKQKSVAIDWETVASSLDAPRRLTPTECQQLWRFVAYRMDEYGHCDDCTELDLSAMADDESDIDQPVPAPRRQSSSNDHDETRKRKWTPATDVKLLRAILEHGDTDWEAVRTASGLLSRDLSTLEDRWRVIQRSVTAGRYRNERIVSLVDAIQRGRSQPTATDQTAVDAIKSLMALAS